MNALVTDGDERSALAIVRSLGRRGIDVLVGEERPVSLASSSRYCARHIVYPSPYREPDAFGRFLLDVVEREKIDVVMPVSDVTTSAAARNRDALARRCAVAAPPYDAFEFVTNKCRLLQCAAASGIPIPRTCFVDGIDGLNAHVDRLEYPVVVKPVRSRISTDTGWLSTSVHYAYSESDLRHLYREHAYLTSYPSLIQERIVGPGVGVFVLFDRGHLLAAFAHRRLREKPPSGGVSVLRESVPLPPSLRHYAVRLLGSLGWHGVAMMEFKQDHRTGNHYLMEVNGRFWGSLQLAIDAGVDFPYLFYQLALDRHPDVCGSYRAGVKSRWLLGDLDHLLLRLFKSNRALRLPESAPSRARTLLDFLKFAEPGLHYEVVDPDDLQPCFREIRQYARAFAAGAAQSVGRGVGRLMTAR